MEIRLSRAKTAVRAASFTAMLAMGLALGPTVAAQEPVSPAAAIDTSTVPPAPASVDTAASPGSSISGRGAFVRSLVLPGWGQAYVGAPGRGAIYFALEAGSAWMAYKSYQQLSEARDAQAWLRQAGRLGENETLDVVESREAQLEDWLAISIFLLLFSGADAYVTAQLADFDEHVGVRPVMDGGAGLELRVPFGPRRR